jgi:hypothetical protein
MMPRTRNGAQPAGDVDDPLVHEELIEVLADVLDVEAVRGPEVEEEDRSLSWPVA